MEPLRHGALLRTFVTGGLGCEIYSLTPLLVLSASWEQMKYSQPPSCSCSLASSTTQMSLGAGTVSQNQLSSLSYSWSWFKQQQKGTDGVRVGAEAIHPELPCLLFHDNSFQNALPQCPRERQRLAFCLWLAQVLPFNSSPSKRIAVILRKQIISY